MLYLEVETRAGTRQVPLVGPRMTIGRLSYNDIVIGDNQISRQHAELRYVDGIWWIADLKSTNGIHLNERRIPVHRLTNGDCLTLAPEVRLRVYDDQHAPQRTPQGASGAASASAVGWSASGVARAAPLAFAQSPAADLASPPANGNSAANANNAAPVPIAPSSSANARTSGPALPRAQGVPLAASAPEDPAAQRVTSRPAFGGPWSAGGETDDPFRRSLADAKVRPNLIPEQRLLHVCQTCGQLTAPDAIYCQSCHQSIVYACAHCGFSLLPIQDRCPRCQVPNPGSVRRAHRLTS